MPRKARTADQPMITNTQATQQASNMFRPNTNDGRVWLSISEAATHLEFSAITGANKVRNLAKSSPLLQGDNCYSVVLDGYNIPPILYFDRASLDQIKIALANQPQRGGRGRTPGLIRCTVLIPAGEFDRFAGIFGDHGLALLKPKARVKKTADQIVAAVEAIAPADQPADSGDHEWQHDRAELQEV